jgi:hypothetical protein
MYLPGRLGTTTLGDILGALHRARMSGVLELTETEGLGSGRVHRVHIVGGLVVDVDTSFRVTRLGDILKAAGLLGADSARRLTRRLLGSPHRRCGEILVGEGLVPPDAVARALRQQTRARLEALFSLRDARLSFHLSRPAQRASAFGPEDFLHGRPRRRDADRAPRAADGVDGDGWVRPAATGRAPRGADSEALAVLGLPDGADVSSVHQAFKRLAVRMHPDRFPHADPARKAELVRRFAAISAAYHAIMART